MHNVIANGTPRAVRTMRDGGIPVFADVERTVRCLAALADYGRYLEIIKAEAELPSFA